MVSYLFILTNLHLQNVLIMLRAYSFLVNTGSALFKLRNIKKEVAIDAKAE